MTPAELAQLIGCIDLTSLNTDDTNEKITVLCQKANTPFGYVAAVCVFPQFVAHAWQQLINTPVKIATVANFSSGNESLENVSKTIQQAILDGAAEIDVVIPYHQYQQQGRTIVRDFIKHCKMLCGKNTLLKTILETGALTVAQIQLACEDAIAAGSDFLKTSTGKIAIGATPETAIILLNAIKNTTRPVGFKASGGVRHIEQAEIYRDLAKQILGENSIHADRFRLGASSLLDSVVEYHDA